MEHRYITTGTCSKAIDIEYDPVTHVIGRVTFTGGCHGNLQGIGRLVEGCRMEDVADRLEGVVCRDKPTSCPDQLACALKEILASLEA